jgi:hypothetical protein
MQTKMLNFLTGYRTYLLGAAGIITIILYSVGVVSADSANVLLGIFGFGGFMTLRSSVGSLQSQVEESMKG